MNELWAGLIALAAGGIALAALMAALRRGGRGDAFGQEENARRLAAGQAELAGQLSQIASAQVAAMQAVSERLHAQERTVARVLEERLADVARRVGDGLQVNAEKTFTHMNDLRERLATIDAAQKNILDLSTQVVGLQDILSNKQARGAFGEIQLNDLVRSALPPSAYVFQAVLSNGCRVDCLLSLPNPPGSIAIDAKFPLESYRRLQAAGDVAERQKAGKRFSEDVLKHVRDIAEKYVVAGETAESALMFLPSEAVYAELHARFPAVVENSYRLRVWIVSPTTLMATLNTVRAVLKDARMREQAGTIQAEVARLAKDVERLDERVNHLLRHFGSAQEDVRQIQISAGKIVQQAEKIEELQLRDDDSADSAPSPVLERRVS